MVRKTKMEGAGGETNAQGNGDASIGEVRIRGRFHAEPESQARLPRSYVIPILSKALTILDLIESSDEPLSARQIHERLGYSPATIYRILRTLSAHGVLKGCEHTSYSFKRIEEVKQIIRQSSPRSAK